jgi:hypothetical protein
MKNHKSQQEVWNFTEMTMEKAHYFQMQLLLCLYQTEIFLSKKYCPGFPVELPLLTNFFSCATNFTKGKSQKWMNRI